MVAIALKPGRHWNAFDIAVRDPEIALAALVLAGVTEVRSDALPSDTPTNKVQKGTGDTILPTFRSKMPWWQQGASHNK